MGNPTSPERQRRCRGVANHPLHPDLEEVAQKRSFSIRLICVMGETRGVQNLFKLGF